MGEMLIGIRRKSKDSAPPPVAIEVAPDAVGMTAAAARAIVEKAKSEGRPSALLRIGIRGGGCSGLTYHFGLEDGPKATDLLFNATTADGDAAQVCVDPKSLQYLGGTLLDFQEALGASSFVMKNPHVKSACSCGDSFSV